MPRPARKSSPREVSDEAVKRATGRGWDEWFALLDGIGATSMSHRDIAAWLSEHHIENGWWSQSVTVGYERARGMRQRHETTSGFQVGVSKTVAVGVSTLYAVWADEAARRKWAGASGRFEITSSTPDRSLRGRWPGGSPTIAIAFYDKGADKSQVVVQLEKLASAEQVEEQRAA